MSIYNSSFLLALASCAVPMALCQTIDTQKTSATASVEALVSRVTPAISKLVSFRVDSNAKGFTIEKQGTGIQITAADVQKLAAGYGWYLRNVAKVHFSWNGDRLQIPVPMPAPKEALTVENPWKLNFAFNYCTLSYTGAFWDWKRWQREIDFLALNGFTHALVTAGLEKAWLKFLDEQGYPKDKAMAFIPNPAFAAWWNMGNLEGHGGPMTMALIEQEAQLGKQIVQRMQSLGMVPVMQGYIGFVPSEFNKIIKKEGLKIVPQGAWCGVFSRPAVVDPTCSAFPDMAKSWYKAVEEVYGTKTSVYGGDLFHEGGNRADIDLAAAATAIQTAMDKASPGSKWVLQAWGANPSDNLLKGVKPEQTFVLNLKKDLHNGGKNLRTFNGIPWVWCELANFGGNTGLYGGLPLLARLGSDLKDKEGTGLMGMALLSEGVEINPLHYELFFDRMTTKDDIDLDQWLPAYAQKRYNTKDPGIVQGLKLLAHSIYNPTRDQEGCTESIVCGRPHWGIRKASTWSSGERYYDVKEIVQVASLYLAAAKKDPDLLKQATFRYDLVDVVRQILADATYYQLQSVKSSFDAKDIKAYKKEVAIFLGMIKDMDLMLATNKEFLLGTWQSRALAKGTTAEEKTLMSKAAKMQISLWSGRFDSLNDYSNRQWAGFVKDFYLPRWERFFLSQLSILEGKKPQAVANKEFSKENAAAEQAWIVDPKVYSTQVVGDPYKIGMSIVDKYQALISGLVSNVPKTDGPKWDLSQGNEFSFNVTADVDTAGTYRAIFVWQQGSSALKIDSVALYEGDKQVAIDTHEGFTGFDNKKNTYILNLKKYRTNLDAYTLKVKVSGVSSNDSRGYLSFQKLKENK